MNRPTIPGLNLTIGNIYCIGRNYAEHAEELGNKVPDSPMVFLKPTSTICYNGAEIKLPPQSNDVHHEAEIVVAISKTGKNIPKEFAGNYIGGYGAGIDFTARDIQQKAKEKGHPWTVAKGFDQFAPISDFALADEIEDPLRLQIALQKNGQNLQQGDTSQMIFSVHYLISYLSTIFTLQPGDLIFTGTPKGVAPVQPGDTLKVILGDEIRTLTVSIA